MIHAEPDHAPHRHATVPPWRNARVLRVVLQVIVLIAAAGVIGFLASNLTDAMRDRGLSFSYRFLDQRAGFEIGESPIEYDANASYGEAFTVGLLNTVFVGVLGIVLATVLGVLVGVARLSPNWLVSRVAAGYVEIIRNTPLLVQLFLIYFVVLLQLPSVRDTVSLPGSVFLNQRGLFVPGPQEIPVPIAEPKRVARWCTSRPAPVAWWRPSPGASSRGAARRRAVADTGWARSGCCSSLAWPLPAGSCQPTLH